MDQAFDFSKNQSSKSTSECCPTDSAVWPVSTEWTLTSDEGATPTSSGVRSTHAARLDGEAVADAPGSELRDRERANATRSGLIEALSMLAQLPLTDEKRAEIVRQLIAEAREADRLASS